MAEVVRECIQLGLGPVEWELLHSGDVKFLLFNAIYLLIGTKSDIFAESLLLSLAHVHVLKCLDVCEECAFVRLVTFLGHSEWSNQCPLMTVLVLPDTTTLFEVAVDASDGTTL